MSDLFFKMTDYGYTVELHEPEISPCTWGKSNRVVDKRGRNKWYIIKKMKRWT